MQSLRLGSRPDTVPRSMTEIDRLTQDDWHAWRSLRLGALAEAPEAFGATLLYWTGEGDTEEQWRKRLTDVPLNLIARIDGEPVGMVSGTSPERDVVELISMWVAPRGRGRGIGDALIAEVVAWARTQGASAVALDVRQANSWAISLYARNRFVDIGWTTDGNGPFPERRMIHSL
jgi:GNAT superfamily N-acetyltransferase